MRMIRSVVFASLMGGCLVASAFAQGMLGGPGRGGSGAGLADIFGKDKAFSATAHTTIADGSGKEIQSMDMNYFVLEGKVRMEMDMAKMQGAHMPPSAIAQMKQMGMDRSVHIMLPGKHVSYMVYPGLKAYCEMQIPNAAGPDKETKPPKIDRTEIGPDTIDGHPSVKTKVIVTPDGGEPVTTLVWEAKDLDNYPIQTQVQAGDGTTVTTRFKDINKTKPPASLFEPPTDYTRYNNMQELMMSRMGGMGGMPSGHPPIPPRGGTE